MLDATLGQNALRQAEDFDKAMRVAGAEGQPDKGGLTGIDYILGQLSCAQAQPIEPRDEMAELQRAFIESVNLQAKLAERMERAAGRVNLRAVA